MKILLITNIPNPYRIPLFNTLNAQLKDKKSTLTVLFGAKTYKRRKFQLDMSQCKFNYQTLQSKGFNLLKSEGLVFTYPGIIRYVFKNKPDKIIVSGFSVATIKLFLYSFLFSTPYYIWSGAIHKPGRFDGKKQLFIRRLLIKRAAGFIVYGTMAKAYLTSLGALPNKIKIATNTVDTNFFSEETAKIKSQLKPNKTPILSYIGYINKRKDVHKLILLAEELAKTIDFKLLIIGDGEEKTFLEKVSQEKGLENKITFAGFKQKEEIPAYLAATDLFLFQTSFDIWGLVLNEAMAAGCCCLASPKAGATHDLIEDGENGYKVDFSDTKYSVSLIKRLLQNPEKGLQMGEFAKKTIKEKATLHQAANSFISMLKQ